MVVVPVAVLAAAVVAASGFVDVDALWSDLTRPALAPASGQVLFRGQPLLNGQITTQPVAGRGVSALGWTDDEGRFSLKTDIRGSFVDGAPVGEHRVTVTAYAINSGAAAPALLTPAQYASMGTSPLKITVERNSDKNEFKLVLEGDPPPSRPSPPANSKQGAPKQRAPKQGASKQSSTPEQPC